MAEGALAVDLARVALPPVGGSCSPADHLTGRAAAEFANIEQTLAPSLLPLGPLTTGCHEISHHDEVVLVGELLSRSMAVLLEEEALPTDAAGKALVGGSPV